jgi:DNA-directed RNA polymerase specialized sigma24 family protein
MVKIFTFEDKIDIICKAINKKRNKWHLNAITWMDFDDVTQIIKLHIYKKWPMWDQTKPLEPWIGRIISNQLKNLIRNNYTNYVRPCLSCPYNIGDDQCSLTANGFQNNTCALFSKWEKTKKSGYDLKMPVTIENHRQEIESCIDNASFSFISVELLNNEMQKALTSKQYSAYIMLFFEKVDEEDVAKFMGYKTNEKNRMIGYKQIKNLKKLFREKASEILNNKDICYGSE